MNTEEMEKLYTESISFKLYVDRICKSYKITKDTAFKDALVKSYAEYVLKDQPENAKEAKYEVKQDCGC